MDFISSKKLNNIFTKSPLVTTFTLAVRRCVASGITIRSTLVTTEVRFMVMTTKKLPYISATIVAYAVAAAVVICNADMFALY